MQIHLRIQLLWWLQVGRKRRTASAHCYWARVHAQQYSTINLVKVIFPVRHCRVKSSLSSPAYKVILEWAITALRCGVCCSYTEWVFAAFFQHFPQFAMRALVCGFYTSACNNLATYVMTLEMAKMMLDNGNNWFTGPQTCRKRGEIIKWVAGWWDIERSRKEQDGRANRSRCRHWRCSITCKCTHFKAKCNKVLPHIHPWSFDVVKKYTVFLSRVLKFVAEGRRFFDLWSAQSTIRHFTPVFNPPRDNPAELYL